MVVRLAGIRFVGNKEKSGPLKLCKKLYFWLSHEMYLPEFTFECFTLRSHLCFFLLLHEIYLDLWLNCGNSSSCLAILFAVSICTIVSFLRAVYNKYVIKLMISIHFTYWSLSTGRLGRRNVFYIRSVISPEPRRRHELSRRGQGQGHVWINQW